RPARGDERRGRAPHPAGGRPELHPGGGHARRGGEGRRAGRSTMSILVDEKSRVVVQGITGREGTFHTRQCREYGTKVVAGVTPGRGGIVHEGVPVFNTVKEAVEHEAAEVSLIFVPPASAADAILEAADAGIRLVV